MKHKRIDKFIPDMQDFESAYRDFAEKINSFDAGGEYSNFNSFIKRGAAESAKTGDGTSFIIWNIIKDSNGNEIDRDMVAFYTISANAIPYESRIRLEPDEAEKLGTEFDSKLCGIPALELLLFAVNKKYQDTFYDFEGIDLPVSVWALAVIIKHARVLIKSIISFKVIFLHALPEAEQFYLKNGFTEIEENMKPFYSADSEFKPMYFIVKEIHMCYDD